YARVAAGRNRPGRVSWRRRLAGIAWQASRLRHGRGRTYLTMSLRLLSARILTLLRAGLALTSSISPGLNRVGRRPALVAGLLTILNFIRPPTATAPGP